MPDLSPARTNSKASRYPIFCMPVTSYAFECSGNGRKVNASLQSVFTAIVEDINVLSEFGLKTERHGAPRLHPVEVAVLRWALF